MARFLDAPVMPHPLAATFGNFDAARTHRGRVEALGSRRAVDDVPAIVDNTRPTARPRSRPEAVWGANAEPRGRAAARDTPLTTPQSSGPSHRSRKPADQAIQARRKVVIRAASA